MTIVQDRGKLLVDERRADRVHPFEHARPLLFRMSGILGLWRLDGRPVEPEALATMSDRLAHRGPDGAEAWRDGPVGLGHRAFHTTPESSHERRLRRDGERVLTADARIDNRHELIRSMGLEEVTEEQIDDATLLIAAYERWGDRCPERLIGDFAFAIWDAGRRSLFCVRDHFGVKPFYYFHAPRRLFAFASEIEALLSHPEIPDEIDDHEVARHLRVPLRGDVSTTYYRHVRRLSPAHALTVSEGGLEERRYWQLDPAHRTTLSSDEEYAEALRDVFVEAVRCRLRSVGPVASMLSGGIDSSAITCVAARALEDARAESPLHTLSAVYPRIPQSDERAFIDEVLERHDVVPHFFEADDVSPIAEIDRMNRFIGGPSYGTNLYLNWELFGLAADAGARVVLDGFDGDATVSHGKGYLSELAISGRWIELARVGLPYLRRQGDSPFADYLALVRFGLRRRLRGSAWESLIRRARRGRGGPARERTATPGPLAIDERFARVFSDRLEAASAPSVTEREIHRDMMSSQNLLEALGWIEACGAGRGVEVRFPFFDVRVVDLCLSFPPEQKLRRGWSRSVMRRAMEGILPPSIQWRSTKANLRHGWKYALRSDRSGRIESLLREPGPVVEHYLDLDRVRTLHDRFVSGDSDTSEDIVLWRALSLALWLTGEEHRRRSGRRVHREERVPG